MKSVRIAGPGLFSRNVRLLALLLGSLSGRFAGAQAPATPPVLTPTEALRTFTVPPGFRIDCIAAEPHLCNPMSMALDETGRIYVSLAHSYRYGAKGSPVEPPSNPVVRLQIGPDGQAVGHTVVCDGFSEPVVGLAVRDGRLWATNLNQVFVAPLDEKGRAGERTILIRDAETPWNPFGMYRLEFGRDGLIYLSIGDHPTRLQGPDRTGAVRGSTGAVFRFQPDGRQLELLLQGMRAPFTFDIDPFGALWVLSNGEGNPNRLIRAIRGADYHFQTRKVDWEWLAGRHPLAPPVWENPPGAHTGIVWYCSSNFPDDYWGNLLVSNWGVHGYPSANHVIVRHVLDERGERIRTGPFLTTSDYRFRPTQITLAPDGGLYVLDWYGIDDENDLNGRLYKISYTDRGTGPEASGQQKTNEGRRDRHFVPQSRAGAGRTQDDPGPESLASRNHWHRQRSARRLRAQGALALDELRSHLRQPDPLAAAEALWVLRGIDGPAACLAIESALEHADGRVRRLAVQLLAEIGPYSPAIERRLEDGESAVQVEAAAAIPEPARRLRELGKALRQGAAAEPRLRYRAALAYALHADEAGFESLLGDSDANVRLAGLIALDEAFHETRRAEAARAVLVRFLKAPRQIAAVDLLATAERWPHPDFQTPVVERMRHAEKPEEFARGLAVLRRLGLPTTRQTMGDATETFLSRLRDIGPGGTATSNKTALLEILATDSPGPRALSLLADLMRDTDPAVRAAVHDILTGVGAAEPACLDLAGKLALEPAANRHARLEAIVTMAQLERQLQQDRWRTLLSAADRDTALVSLRCLKNHADRAGASRLTATLAADGRAAEYAEDLAFVQAALRLPGEARPPLDRVPAPSARPAELGSKEAVRRRLLERLAGGSPVRGALVFRGQVCHRCHGTSAREAPLGPPLAGIAANNGVEYLLDSILYPSAVIKTGYLLEIVATQSGELYSGKVSQEGNALVITSGPGRQVRIPISDVEARRQEKISLMPEGLEQTMSEPELIDLIAYLASLK